MAQLSYTQWVHFCGCVALGFFSSLALVAMILHWSKSRGHAVRGDFHHGKGNSIPRLGGLAMAGSYVVVASWIYVFGDLSPKVAEMLFTLSATSLSMFFLGFCDDLMPLNAKFKLICQILIASAAWLLSVRVETFKDPFVDHHLIELGASGYFITVLWLVGLTNLINLIDGIDGLAAGICIMLMFLLANLGMEGGGVAVTALLAAGAGGGLLGFLRFNYPPAKIYMGDGGAYFMGFLIAELGIVSSNKGTVVASLVAPAFVLALPIVDVSLAILRRGLRGLPIFRPDRKHIHHRLITLGISHERAVLNLYTVALLSLLLAISVCYVQARWLPIFAGLLCLMLLIAGHYSGLTRDWFKVGSHLGKALALRKDTRYAMILSRALVLEVDRGATPDAIWLDYRRTVKKLGFCRVVITLPKGLARTWQNDGPIGEVQQSEHAMGDGTVLHFDALKAEMTESQFDLLSDLAAETWYALVRRWQKIHKKPFHLKDDEIES
jgi:UDP-GlcNAc:undecaprenyl-phosphate GlcNAc-1-phosphate transferase